MLSAEEFLNQLSTRGFKLFTGVPCSLLNALYQGIAGSQEIRYLPAANEGDAVALAAGAELGGLKSVVTMQNSGLGNAVNPLTSLTHTYRIPVLLVISLRGDPGEKPDAPQHRLMGRITTALLENMEIPWSYLPNNTPALQDVLRTASEHMSREKRPYALIVRKKTLNGGTGEGPSPPQFPRRKGSVRQSDWPEPLLTRPEFLAELTETVDRDTLLVATTGHTGRELYTCSDRPRNFYMAGSMGCASSVGLGLAVAQPGRRVVVLDGDAALTMRMGTLATVGVVGPGNFFHLLFDNGVNQSTGGQPSPSEGVDFAEVAAACGYKNTFRGSTLEEMSLGLSAPGPVFSHLFTKPDSQEAPSRPEMPLPEVAERLRDDLR